MSCRFGAVVVFALGLGAGCGDRTLSSIVVGGDGGVDWGPTGDHPPDPCAPNPCLHGGICNNTQGTATTCTCPTGLGGDRCEIVPSPVLAVGDGHVCTLRWDDSVYCWGDNFSGQCDAPAGRFTRLAAGLNFTCGQRAEGPEGAIVCWGDLSSFTTSPPDIGATDLVASNDHACALLAGSGQAVCWGGNEFGESDAPTDIAFSAISTGFNHTCGVRSTDGSVLCWGVGDREPLAGGPFTAVTTNADVADPAGSFTCAIAKVDGSIHCAGGAGVNETAAPAGSFRALSSGVSQACALGTDGTVACWGDGGRGPLTAPPGAFTALGVGAYVGCGLDADGHTNCWTADRGDMFPADGRYAAVSGGGPCLIDPVDRSVRCVGWWDPPTGRFAAISSTDSHACGLREDGTLACWGRGDVLEGVLPPPGAFASVSATGCSHICAVRLDGTIVCWGENDYGQATAPAFGTFSAVSAGCSHSCAIGQGGQITCWGSNDAGESTPPAGPFDSVVAGWNRSCAIRSGTHTVTCWGDITEDVTPPAATAYGAVGFGVQDITCALRASDHAVQCWGGDQFKLMSTPAGAFASLVVDGFHACALDASGRLRCWGDRILGVDGP